MGRAARNVESQVILYADTETESIRQAVEETRRRREKQMAFNEAHGIVPRSVEKEITNLLPPELAAAYSVSGTGKAEAPRRTAAQSMTIREMEQAMWEAVEKLDFERAAALRDLIAETKGEPITREKGPAPRDFRQRRRARERPRK